VNGTLITGGLMSFFANFIDIPESSPQPVTLLTTTASATSKCPAEWVSLGKAPPYGFPQSP
jgi:hypothetical protein